MHTLSKFITRFCLLLLSALALPAFAQQDPAFSHYWELEPQYNPAAVGRSDQLSVNGAYQTHATGYEDAGGTMYFGADMAFQLGKTRHGVGAVFQNDQIGLFSHKRFALQYAYHFNLWGGRLSIGAEADMLQETINGSKADLADGNDPAFPSTDLNGSQFDVAAGLWYQHKRFYAGVAAQHLTAPVIRIGETNEYAVKRAYNFTAGYNIKLPRTFLSVVPSLMCRYDGHAFRGDATARVVYEYEKKMCYGGVTYSPGHSVTGFVGGRFQGIELGYAYEANTAGLGLGAGQHEVILTYRLPLSFEKKGKNKHKSVRYL